MEWLIADLQNIPQLEKNGKNSLKMLSMDCVWPMPENNLRKKSTRTDCSNCVELRIGDGRPWFAVALTQYIF